MYENGNVGKLQLSENNFQRLLPSRSRLSQEEVFRAVTVISLCSFVLVMA